MLIQFIEKSLLCLIAMKRKREATADLPKPSIKPQEREHIAAPPNDYLSPPNMNKVMKDMQDCNSAFVVNGYSIDANSVQVLDSIAAGISSRPSRALMELFNDMSPTCKPRPLDYNETFNCWRIYNGHASIKLSAREFKGKLFENGFDVSILAPNSKDIIARVTDSIKTNLISNYWMPFLEDHYDWVKTFGICPFYFEPVILTQNNKPAIFYVPFAPKPEMGTIFVYERRDKTQGYFWKWAQGSTNLLSVFDSVLGTGIPAPRSFSTKTTPTSMTPSLFDYGPVPLTTAGGKAPRMTDNNRACISGAKSRYMFFSVKSRPSLFGTLTSDIKSIMSEMLLLEKMESLEVLAAQKQMNPPCIIEFTPNPVQMTRGDTSDNTRLKLDTQLKMFLSTGAALDGDQRQELHKSITDNPILSGNPVTGRSEGAMERLLRAQQRIQAPLNSPDARLNMIDPQDFAQGAYDPNENQSGESTEWERTMLYIKNNPGAPLAETITKMGNTRLKEPNNATYLKPFHKLSSAAPKVTVPNFGLDTLKIRMDKLAASIVDFPLELIMNRTGRSGGKEDESAGAQFLKGRLTVEAKYYEHVVRHMWWMSSLSFIKSTREILDILRESTKDDGELAKPSTKQEAASNLPDISPKMKTAIYTLTQEEVEAWNNINVTFPKTPFIDLETSLTLYEVGLVDESQLIEYIATLFNLPKNTADAGRVKQFMTEYFKRKYGEANIELQAKLSAKEERIKEKNQSEMQEKEQKAAKMTKVKD